MDNKITVSILTHRCQCPHIRLKRGGDRGGATHIHKRKLSSEPHVKKRYKLGNHLFYTPDADIQLRHFRLLIEIQRYHRPRRERLSSAYTSP
jgi:hypothetical protein